MTAENWQFRLGRATVLMEAGERRGLPEMTLRDVPSNTELLRMNAYEDENRYILIPHPAIIVAQYTTPVFPSDAPVRPGGWS